MGNHIFTASWRMYAFVFLGWVIFGSIFGFSVLSTNPMAGATFLVIVTSLVISLIAPAIHSVLLRSISKQNGIVTIFQIILMAGVTIVIVMVMCAAIALTGIFNFT